MDKFAPNKHTKKVGLLGGSFNPAHEGHLYISQKAFELLKLDEIWWILSPHNPLKDKRTLWPYEERLASVKALIKDQPYIHLSEVESEINSQYTTNTLTHLCKQHPHKQFVWLMGEDNLYSFHRWHAWETIANTMPIAVLARKVDIDAEYHEGLLSPQLIAKKIPANHATNLLSESAPAWVFLPIEHHPQSGTQIRQNLT